MSVKRKAKDKFRDQRRKKRGLGPVLHRTHHRFIYRGVMFASKIEVAWASFFHEMGIQWRYEPIMLTLSDGTKYPPDFYLPQLDVYVECKGRVVHHDIQRRMVESTVLLGVPIILAEGSPVRSILKQDYHTGFTIYRSDKQSFPRSQLGICSHCGGVSFYRSTRPKVVVGECRCEDGRRRTFTTTPKLKEAARKQTDDMVEITPRQR